MKRYYWAKTIAEPDSRKLYARSDVFLIDFSGCINSFGLASFVVTDMGVLLLWAAAGPSRKSKCDKNK